MWKQDPRYASIGLGDNVLDDRLSGEFGYEIEAYPFTSHEPDGPLDPAVLPTCLRGCLCGYSATPHNPESIVYDWCDCVNNLPLVFSFLASTAVYTTPTNLSLLAHHNISYDDFNASIAANYLGRRETPLWVNVSEGSNLTIQKGFECFGDYETIANIIDPARF